MTQLSGGLTAQQQTQFHEEGYVVVPDLFVPEALEPLRQEIAGIVDASARRMLAEGKITDLHADEPLETRLTCLLHDHPELTPVYQRDIEGKGGGGHTGRAMFDLITHPRLLDAMESLVGPEIVASSVYRIRPKVPGWNRGEIPWHQDSGYFARHCDNDLIVTVWIPLVAATIENGCLLVLPNAHRHGVVTHNTHGPGGYLIIEDDNLPFPESEAIYAPVPLGCALLLTNLTPHASRANTTDTIRWSIDLRYQSRDVPTNAFQEPEDYDPNAPEIQIACYAPEGDFVVRSTKDPESVPTYEQYVARRKAYEAAPLPGPNRGWQPRHPQ